MHEIFLFVLEPIGNTCLWTFQKTEFLINFKKWSTHCSRHVYSLDRIIVFLKISVSCTQNHNLTVSWSNKIAFPLKGPRSILCFQGWRICMTPAVVSVIKAILARRKTKTPMLTAMKRSRVKIFLEHELK